MEVIDYLFLEMCWIGKMGTYDSASRAVEDKCDMMT